jgi:3-methyladenine DNA glycosylase AlkD
VISRNTDAVIWPSFEVLAREIRHRVRNLPSGGASEVRHLRREYSRRLHKAPGKLVLRLAGQLNLAGVEFRFFAGELLRNHSAFGGLDQAELEVFGRGMNSWAAVDIFSVCLAGPAWRAGQIRDSVIHRWARSADRWWRRAALVSTVPLNSRAQGGNGDARRTLQICRLLASDRDPMVMKALSWALRELAKRDPHGVENFLAQLGDRLPALVRREVLNKLTTGRKRSPRKLPLFDRANTGHNLRGRLRKIAG